MGRDLENLFFKLEDAEISIQLPTHMPHVVQQLSYISIGKANSILSQWLKEQVTVRRFDARPEFRLEESCWFTGGCIEPCHLLHTHSATLVNIKKVGG